MNSQRPVFNQVVMMLKKAFKKIPNNTNLTLIQIKVGNIK
jgi:hypothetical protein